MRKMVVIEEAKDIILLAKDFNTNEWVPAGGPDVTSIINSSFRIGNKIFVKMYIRFRTNIGINTFTSQYRFGFILNKNHVNIVEFNQNATKYPSLINIQGGTTLSTYNSEWATWNNKGSVAIINNFSAGAAGTATFTYLNIEGIMEDPTWVKGYKYTWSIGNNDASWTEAGPYILTNESTGETIKLSSVQESYSDQYIELVSAGKWVMPYTGSDYDDWSITYYAYDKDRNELIKTAATYNTEKKQYELVVNYSNIDMNKIVNVILIAE